MHGATMNKHSPSNTFFTWAVIVIVAALIALAIVWIFNAPYAAAAETAVITTQTDPAFAPSWIDQWISAATVDRIKELVLGAIDFLIAAAITFAIGWMRTKTSLADSAVVQNAGDWLKQNAHDIMVKEIDDLQAKIGVYGQPDHPDEAKVVQATVEKLKKALPDTLKKLDIPIPTDTATNSQLHDIVRTIKSGIKKDMAQASGGILAAGVRGIGRITERP